MRIQALRLLAFGSFTGRELRFDEPGARRDVLHVVYGANEAGKSTALRAIAGLLFGIAPQTKDAYLHRMADLRVGGVLEAADGSTLELVRRKGNKNTLLDPAGQVLPEARLGKLLGGATEASFRALFGLDHVSLREGAQALLDARGDVGEGLFDAALGAGRGAARILEALEAEAEAIFAPQAHKRPLNESLRALGEARAQSRERARSGEAWVTQLRGLEDAQAELERLRASVRDARRELQRRQRRKRLLPLCAQRTDVLQRRAALGAVVELPANAPDLRREAETDLQAARADIVRLDEDLALTAQQRDGLVVPAWLDDPHVGEILRLPDRLGGHRNARDHRPGLARKLAALQPEIEAALARVGAGDAHELDAAGKARIGELALEEAGLRKELLERERHLGQCAERHRQHAAAPEALTPAGDVARLRLLGAHLAREGDLDARVDAATKAHDRAAERLARALAGLGLPHREATAVARLPLPVPETIDRFQGDFKELSDRRARLDEERLALERERSEATRALRELQAHGELPSQQALLTARQRRDEAWVRLRATPGQPSEANDERHATFERALADADTAADRLWREADRVARAATIEAALHTLTEAEVALATRTRDLAGAQAALDEAWATIWRPLGVPARTPLEMRGWLRKVDEAVALAGRVLEDHAELTDVRGRQTDLQREVAGALAEAAGSPLLRAAALVEARVLAIVEAERAGVERQRQLTQLDADRARAQRERDETSERLATWRRSWADAVAPLGRGATLTVPEAQATLRVLDELEVKQHEVADLRKRVDGIDRDARLFADDVAALVARLAPDLVGREADLAAEELLRRHREGVTARDKGEELARRLDAFAATRRSAVSRLAQAQGKLDRLAADAKCARPEELPAAERRSAHAAELEEELRDAETQILIAAEGGSLEEALGEAQLTDADAMDDAVQAASEEVERLENELSQLNKRIGSYEAGFHALNQGDGGVAAEAATEAHAHAARARALAERYARLRLGAVLLAQEIERQRERHQDPVLTRAGQVLAALTEGRYAGLRAELDDTDHFALRCVQADGTRIPVEALSDGARDQLYLALRLATLQVRPSGEAMPLILDDILIHFDDRRAAAALGVLATHAATTQVILFSHHARVVELAEATLPGRVRVTRLE